MLPRNVYFTTMSKVSAGPCWRHSSLEGTRRNTTNSLCMVRKYFIHLRKPLCRHVLIWMCVVIISMRHVGQKYAPWTKFRSVRAPYDKSLLLYLAITRVKPELSRGAYRPKSQLALEVPRFSRKSPHPWGGGERAGSFIITCKHCTWHVLDF